MAVGLTKALRDERIERPDIARPESLAESMRHYAERTRPPRAGDEQADSEDREAAQAAGGAEDSSGGRHAGGRDRETVVQSPKE